MTGTPRTRSRAWPLVFAIASIGLALVAAAWPALGGVRARTHRVEIRDFLFRPAPLEMALGDTIVWSNRDIVPHAVGAEGGGWRSPDLATGESWRLVPRARGRVSYDCPLHPTMKGTLVVR